MRSLGRVLTVLFLVITVLGFKNVETNAAGLPVRVQIESPDGSVNGMCNSVNVSGWAIGENGIRCVRMYLDSNYVGDATTGIDRADIGNQYPDYKDSAKGGYTYSLDISNVSAGEHTVTAEAEDNDGNVAAIEKKISITGIGASYTTINNIVYSTSIAGRGWRGYVSSNNVSGQTSGINIMDGLRMNFNGSIPGARILYKAYVHGKGWQGWASNGSVAGSVGSGRNIQAVKVSIKGLSSNYHVVYQVYLYRMGWQNVVHDGKLAGCINKGTYIQAIRVKLADSNRGTYNPSQFKLKFAIDIGHNNPHDSGAKGIKVEDNLNMQVGTRVISKLRALGYTVVSTLPPTASSRLNSLQQRVYTANVNEVDRFVSIHFNFGGGSGAEVFTYRSSGDSFARNVLKQLVGLGYANRGIKHSNYYVIHHTNAKAILIEGAFVDSKKDMARFNAEKMAQAIVRGLIKER